MSLSAGVHLGPYEIVGLIGAGGMGEVYRARDTRLDRTVAIKILPAATTGDPIARARLEREARAIAALTHPNICTLHDVGEHDGTVFLVMQHLDGETLAGRLARGPLPVHEALTIAGSIAEALSAAHQQGVVHRDLKPSNVMLTRQGVRLLDFGLAKLVQRDDAGPTAFLESAATASGSLTAAGTIAGTLPYMAPEQLESRPVDGRTDIWALGAILYEMLAGRRPFEGSSPATVLGAILERDPIPLTTLQPGVPGVIDRAIRQCLAKNPHDRPDTARDLSLALRWLGEAAAPGSAPPARPRSGLWTVALVAFGLGVAALTAFAVWPSARLTTPPRPTTFAVELSENESFDGSGGVAVSPDGSRIAFVAARDGVVRLFVRAMNELDAEPLAGTEGAAAPFFSPDGLWLGFFADDALKKVPLAGGTPTTICMAGYRRGGTWLDHDVIVFGSNPSNGLMRVSAAGSTPTPLTTAAEHESHRWPEALPGGRAVIFTIAPSPVEDVDAMQLAAIDLVSGEQRILTDGAYPRYAQPGYLTFVRDDVLWVVRFDPEQLTMTGEPVRLGESPVVRPGGFSEHGLGRDGTLAFRPTNPDSAALGWVDRTGRFVKITAPGLSAPRLSPDGRSVAGIRGGFIWVHDLARGTSTRITSPESGSPAATSVAWSNDGRRILFTSTQRAQYDVAADGGSMPVRLTPTGAVEVAGEWLPDGTRLFARLMQPTDFDLWVQRPGATAAPLVSATGSAEVAPTLSPDGRWLAYRAGVAGRPGPLYVQPYPAGQRVQVSAGNATGTPRWGHDSRALFFVSESLQMTEVHVDRGSPGIFAAPMVLFHAARLGRVFDIDREGRFLMASIPDAHDLVVKTAWLQQLRHTQASLR